MIKSLKFYGIILSVVGFFITGILAYPYGCHWDSGWVFSHIYNEGEPYLNNWMGWYYPYLWYGLYKLTGFFHAMGLFQILLYWSAVTIFYVYGCNNSVKSFICYALFAFFPVNLFFITSITNNALVYVYLLFSLSMFEIYKKKHNIVFLWISIFVLYNVLFIRRDTFLFVVPFMTTLLYSLYGKKGLMLKKIWPFLLVIASVVVVYSCEYAVTRRIANYSKINNVQYIALYDLTGMSRESGELLWPRSIISDEYVNSDSVLYSIMETKGLYGDVEIFYNHDVSRFLKTKYHLSPDLTGFMPIYLSHLPEYLSFRSDVIWKTFTNDDGILYQCDGMSGIEYPISAPKLLHNKLAWAFPNIFRMILLYIIVLVALFVCDMCGLVKYLSSSQKIICRSIAFSCLLTIAITSLCLVTTQNRYFFPYLLIPIGMYLYVYVNNGFIHRKNG